MVQWVNGWGQVILLNNDIMMGGLICGSMGGIRSYH